MITPRNALNNADFFLSAKNRDINFSKYGKLFGHLSYICFQFVNSF